METILYNLLEALRITAVLITPFMPGSAAKIMGKLGVADPAGQNFEGIRKWGGLRVRSELKRGEYRFPRVEIKAEAANPEPVRVEVPPIKPEISYEESEKIDLLAAKVLAAERVPKSSKLLRLTVKIDGGGSYPSGFRPATEDRRKDPPSPISRKFFIRSSAGFCLSSCLWGR